MRTTVLTPFKKFRYTVDNLLKKASFCPLSAVERKLADTCMSGSRRRLLLLGVVGQLRLEGRMDISTCLVKLSPRININTMLHLGTLALPNTHVIRLITP